MGEYSCECEAGWAGDSCHLRVETDCQDGLDNDQGRRAIIMQVCLILRRSENLECDTSTKIKFLEPFLNFYESEAISQ
jgi:hypothetical protein